MDVHATSSGQGPVLRKMTARTSLRKRLDVMKPMEKGDDDKDVSPVLWQDDPSLEVHHQGEERGQASVVQGHAVFSLKCLHTRSTTY